MGQRRHPQVERKHANGGDEQPSTWRRLTPVRASACCDLLIRNCPVQFAARVCSCPGPASSRACEIVASFAIIRMGIMIPGGPRTRLPARRGRAVCSRLGYGLRRSGGGSVGEIHLRSRRHRPAPRSVTAVLRTARATVAGG